MCNEQNRHEISDRVWELLAPMLPGQEGQWGGVARDNRRFLNGVFWEMRTGAPWRELPPEYGKWISVYQRFRRWRDKGIWEKILEVLINEPEFQWMMFDENRIKSRSPAARMKGGDLDLISPQEDPTPKYIWPWMQMVCRSEYLLRQMPQRITNRMSH